MWRLSHPGRKTLPDASFRHEPYHVTIYLHTVVRGLLGITPHAPESATICPYLARDRNISVKRLAVGESLLSFELRWDSTDVAATVRNEGNVIDVDFGIVVSVIADCMSATITVPELT